MSFSLLQAHLTHQLVSSKRPGLFVGSPAVSPVVHFLIGTVWAPITVLLLGLSCCIAVSILVNNRQIVLGTGMWGTSLPLFGRVDCAVAAVARTLAKVDAASQSEWVQMVRRMQIALLLLAIALEVGKRAHALPTEMTVEPWLITRGLHLYGDIANQHSPLLTYLLAGLFHIFGFTNMNMVCLLILVLVSIVTGYLVYALALSLRGTSAALAALALFTAGWPLYGGSDVWFDTFLPCPVIAALLLLRRESLIAWLGAGVVLGLAILVKQQALPVSLVLYGTLVLRKVMRPMVTACIGTIIPLAIWLCVTISYGDLAQSLYWLVTYNLAGPYRQMASLLPDITEGLWLVALWGLPILLLVLAGSRAQARPVIALLAFALVGALPAVPRYGDMHLALAISLLAVAGGVAFDLARKMRRLMSELILTGWIAGLVLHGTIGAPVGPLLLQPQASTNDASHAPLCLISDVRQLSTASTDRLMVLNFGYESLYAAANRLPAGRLYYSLEWYTVLPVFRSDVAREIGRHIPKVVVLGTQTDPPYAIDPFERRELPVLLHRAGYVIQAGCAHSTVWVRLHGNAGSKRSLIS